MRSVVNPRLLVAGGLVLGSLVLHPAGVASAKELPADPASALVQQALTAEAEGDLDARARLLTEARSASSAEKLARWQQGYIQNGKTWKTYDEVVADGEKSKAMELYRSRRKGAESTVASQSELARFCRKAGLADQEQAHWYAVLAIDPTHAEAQQRLGVVNYDGQWLDADEVKALKEQAKRVTAALRSEEGALKALARDLKAGKITPDAAGAQLAAKNDPDHIPAWERFLSSAHDEGARAVVAALAAMQAPDASLSLARHALYSPHEFARTAAVEALRHKDRHTYVPQLITSLRGPWITDVKWRYDAAAGVVNCRYSMFSESEDKASLRVLDESTTLTGFVPDAARQVRDASVAREAAVARENVAIEKANEPVMDLLAELTGERSVNTPHDWWRWWEDQNEVFTPGERPVERTYDRREATTFGDPGQDRIVIRQEQRIRTHECLAGGTKILTDRGPVAVDRIKAGDLVLSRHPKTGETALKPVLETTQRSPEKLLTISLGDRTIRASGGHPFWVSGEGWVLARNLKPGMMMHGLSEPAEITAVVPEEKLSKSFNLVVADFHSYFVETGDARVFSHDNSVRKPADRSVPGLAAR